MGKPAMGGVGGARLNMQKTEMRPGSVSLSLTFHGVLHASGDELPLWIGKQLLALNTMAH